MNLSKYFGKYMYLWSLTNNVDEKPSFKDMPVIGTVTAGEPAA